MIYIGVALGVVFAADILLKALSALKEKSTNKEHCKKK